jgi:hypothetical protein
MPEFEDDTPNPRGEGNNNNNNPNNKDNKDVSMSSHIYKRRTGRLRKQSWTSKGLSYNESRGRITISTFIMEEPSCCFSPKNTSCNATNRTNSSADKHKRRPEIDLAKEDITVFNNNKIILGAPTEFVLEIKFQSYTRKNWHICFRTVEDQMQWQKILLGYDDKKKKDNDNDYENQYDNENKNDNSKQRSGSVTEDDDLEDGSSEDLVLTQSKSSSSSSSEIQVPVVPVDQETVEHWSDDNQEQESEATFIPRFAMSIITFASSILNVFYRLFGFHSEQTKETSSGVGVDIGVANTRVTKIKVETPAETSFESSTSMSTSNTSQKKQLPGLSFPRVTLRSESSLNETIQSAGGVNSAASARVLAAAGAQETNQNETHCFMNSPPSCFDLRVGPNYKKNKKKGPSAPALYDVHMMDFCANDTFISNVQDVFDLPVIKGITDQDTGCSLVPPVIIFNAQMPSKSTFNYSVIAYGIITEDTKRQLKNIETASPAVKLLVEYCKKAESDKEMLGRTKLLGRIEGIETTG